jgi:MFS transporter, DHA3 family, macrolide efflux protein
LNKLNKSYKGCRLNFFSIFKYKNFKNLYLAASLSEFGSFITDTAIMLWLYSLVGESKSWLGISRTVFILSYAIGSFVGGSFKNYKYFTKILFAADIVRIPLILSIIFLETPWIIVSIAGLIAFFQGIFSPLRQSLTNIFVPQKSIKTANSLFSTTMAFLHLLCPYVGSFLYTSFNDMSIIISIDSTTYFLSAILIFFIKYKIPAETQDHLIHKGNKYKIAFQKKGISTILINYCILGTLVGLLIPLLLPYTIDVLKKSNYEYGILMLFFGLGGLIGGLTSEKISQKVPSHKIIIITFILEICMMLFWIQFKNFWASSFILMLWGQIVFTRIPSQFNYVSETVETSLLPAVYSLLQIAFLIPNLIGSLVVVFFGDKYSTITILTMASYIFLGFGAVRIFSPDVRDFYTRTPSKITRNLD